MTISDMPQPLMTGTGTVQAYDVRDAQLALIGFTRENPALHFGRRGSRITVAVGERLSAYVQRDADKIAAPSYRSIEVRVELASLANKAYCCWTCHPDDVQALVDARWLERTLDRDRLREFADRELSRDDVRTPRGMLDRPPPVSDRRPTYSESFRENMKIIKQACRPDHMAAAEKPPDPPPEPPPLSGRKMKLPPPEPPEPPPLSGRKMKLPPP